MNITLRCKNYRLYRAAGQLTTIEPELILMLNPSETEEMAEAVKRIEMFLQGEINIVKATDKPRCFYCASLNDEDVTMCAQCGAPL